MDHSHDGLGRDGGDFGGVVAAASGPTAEGGKPRRVRAPRVRPPRVRLSHPIVERVGAKFARRVQAQLAEGRVEFAEFLERNADDINAESAVDGITYPTSLAMLKMATEFEMNGERKLRSVARLQGGQSRFEYVDDAHPDTLATMSAFDKFQIGIPVFWSGLGYRIQARLKYRNNSGKLSFWYELIRADRVHEAAAKELIEKIRAGLPAGVPLLMGSAKG